MHRKAPVSLVLLSLWACPSEARASGGGFCNRSFGDSLAPLLSVGGGFGGVAYGGRPSGGATWGVEGSAGVFDTEACTWLGLYADRYQDIDRAQRRWSVGPEIGALIFGLDAGYMRYTDDLGDASGFRVRGHLTLGFVGLTIGGGRLWGDGQSFGLFETGILLKLPILPLLTSGVP